MRHQPTTPRMSLLLVVCLVVVAAALADAVVNARSPQGPNVLIQWGGVIALVAGGFIWWRSSRRR